MFQITVAIGQTPFSFMWKTEEKAKQVRAELMPKFESQPTEWVTIEDEFGHQLSIQRSSLHAIIFEDMDQSKLAHCERALHQTKMQNLAHKMADADPALRAARMMNGPMMSPFPTRPANN